MTQRPAGALDLGELARRLMNILRPGAIAETDLSDPRAPRARVRYADGPALTGWLPWMAAAGEDRDWRPPSIGEQVLVLSPCGELSAGWILPGSYSDGFPAPDSSASKRVTAYRDGAIVGYDTGTHELSAVLPAGGSASIEAPEGVAVTGDVTITGDLSADDVSDSLGSMDEIRGVYNDHAHVIPGPPPTTVPAPASKMT